MVRPHGLPLLHISSVCSHEPTPAAIAGLAQLWKVSPRALMHNLYTKYRYHLVPDPAKVYEFTAISKERLPSPSSALQVGFAQLPIQLSHQSLAGYRVKLIALTDTVSQVVTGQEPAYSPEPNLREAQERMVLLIHHILKRLGLTYTDLEWYDEFLPLGNELYFIFQVQSLASVH